MKPAIRWVLFGVVLLAAIAALSLRAMRTSPVTPPLAGPTVDGGSAAAIARPSPADSGTVTQADAGSAASLLMPFPAGPLREEEVTFQIALLPVKRPITGAVEAVRRAAKREYPSLQLVTKPNQDTPAPSVFVNDAALPGLSFEEVTLFGRDLDQKTRIALTKARKALVLEFHLRPGGAFEELRRAHRLAHAVAVPLGAVLYDGESREYFSAGEWQLRRIDSWGEKLPQVPLHISIQTAATRDSQRSVTFGMAKFGLPEVLVARHPPSLGGPLATVINLVAQRLLEQGSLLQEGSLPIEVDAVEEPTVREEMRKLMRGNAAGKVTLSVALTEPLESDPQNRLLELSFGEDAAAGEEAAIRALFGP